MISLPKKWAKSLGIRKGSTLAIEFGREGTLIIYPFRKERGPKYVEIKYPLSSPRRLFDEMVAAYLSGYEVIKLKGSRRIDYRDREIIKDVARRLIGLEIVEEDSTSIAIQFLIETTSLKPKRLFTRMHVITKGMYSDAITSIIEEDHELSKVVVERDDEVDRLYFLLVRLLRSVALDPSLGVEVGLSPIDCLDYRVASGILENIGDISVQLAKLQNWGVKNKEILRRIARELGFMQEKAVNSFLEKSRKEAEKVFELFERVNDAITDSEGTNGGFELHELLRDVAKGSIDIADLVVSAYPR